MMRRRRKEIVLSSAEQAIVDLTNQARANAGLGPLTVNPLLVAAAREHAAAMAAAGVLSHTTDGVTIQQRIKNQGYNFSWSGENIGLKNGVNALFRAWMKDPDHRANILFPQYEEIGVGIAASTKKKKMYFSQVFGTQK